jgi:hypothetical protein
VTKPKASLYEEITAHIVADLEAGIFPWARPWETGGGNQAFALPRNATTGKAYSGINVLILWGRLFERSFTSGRWLTFRQASNLGGTVRKGEHGVTVCYADRFFPKHEQDRTGPMSQDQQAAEGAAIPFLRRYTVFNIDQCDNLPEQCLVEAPALPEREIVPQAEALAVATRADTRVFMSTSGQFGRQISSCRMVVATAYRTILPIGMTCRGLVSKYSMSSLSSSSVGRRSRSSEFPTRPKCFIAYRASRTSSAETSMA